MTVEVIDKNVFFDFWDNINNIQMNKYENLIRKVWI